MMKVAKPCFKFMGVMVVVLLLISYIPQIVMLIPSMM